MSKKVVVTGGKGFIGTHLTEALTRQGYEVATFDIKDNQDVRDTESLKKEFAGAEFVFHLAALPRVQYSIEHPDTSNDTNVNGTLSVLIAAHEAGVKKVIYTASSSAYGDQEVMPLREDMPAHPISPYALQKYVGELYCRLFTEVYSLPSVCLRYFNVYGPGADPNGPYAQVIPKFIEMRLKGEVMTITGDGTQTRDLVHVRDIARANILAATSPNVGKGEVINIGSGSHASINDIAKLIGGPIEYIPARLEPHDTLADITRARELLGWEPTITLEEGINELKSLVGLK
jgi:nucleoside-diphosphate-sugar epimerase